MAGGMNWFISLWLACQSTPAEAQALQETAPAYLTQVSAAQHLGAARIAGNWYGVDPLMLLSVAYHESRFVVDMHTPESGGRVSCGVMTPTPKARCDREELTLLGGYLAGAAHLRTWIDVCHAADHGRHDIDDEVIQRCALWAYAGGRFFHATCAAQPDRSGCDAVSKFEGRARMIRRALGIAL
jgi:soluble lytic murein transglycosylase-like protein